jgi:hypothetical protein
MLPKEVFAIAELQRTANNLVLDQATFSFRNYLRNHLMWPVTFQIVLSIKDPVIETIANVSA